MMSFTRQITVVARTTMWNCQIHISIFQSSDWLWTRLIGSSRRCLELTKISAPTSSLRTTCGPFAVAQDSGDGMIQSDMRANHQSLISSKKSSLESNLSEMPCDPVLKLTTFRSIVLGACFLTSSLLSAANDDALVIRTDTGLVRGTNMGEYARAWLGIPYGKPPFGPLRWKAPQAPEPWKGTLSCEQPAKRKRERGGVEDRLYLNVWRPQSDEQNLPVLVDVHGGGNMGYDGMANIMRTVAHKANCVVVTMNYRIGVYGWFTHPALRTGKPGDELNDSGNFGLLDIIHALRWVRRNIEAFGGDPGNVTLSGESSGASNVSFLLHSELAAPLFHKAFMSSAYPFAAPHSRGDKAAETALINMLVYSKTAADRKAAQALRKKMSQKQVAGFLRSRDHRTLYAGYRRPDGKGMMDWGDLDQDNIPTKYRRRGKPEFCYGYADGHVVSKLVDFTEGNWFPKPVMIGTTRDENKYFHYSHFKAVFDNAMKKKMPLDEAITAGLEGQARVKYASVAEFKRGWNFINRMTTGLFHRFGAHDPARAMVRSQDRHPVYVFRFDYGSGMHDLKYPRQENFEFFLGASHSFELPFFFDWMDVEPPRWVRWQKEQWNEANYTGRKALAGAMSAHLKDFLHSPDGRLKNASGNPITWQPWTRTDEGFIVFDADADRAHIAMSNDLASSPGQMRSELDSWPDQATVDYIKYFIIYSYQMNWY